MAINEVVSLFKQLKSSRFTDELISYALFKHEDDNSYRRIKYVENVFLFTMALNRVYCHWNESIQEMIFFANMPLIWFGNNLVNFYLAKFYVYSIIFSYRLYITPDMYLLSFMRPVALFRSLIFKYFPLAIYFNIQKRTNVLSRLVKAMSIILFTVAALLMFTILLHSNEHFVLCGIWELFGYYANSALNSIACILLLKTFNFTMGALFFEIEMFKHIFYSFKDCLIRKRLSSKQYFVKFTIALKYFLSLNRNLVGNTFVIIMIPFSTFNCYTIVWSFQNFNENQNLIMRFACVFAVVYETIAFFLIFLYLCKSTKYIHCASKALNQRMFKASTRFRNRMFLSLITIEMIHSKKKFGFCYLLGGHLLGLMTISTFIRYVAVTGNLMMKFYKLQMFMNKSEFQ